MIRVTLTDKNGKVHGPVDFKTQAEADAWVASEGGGSINQADVSQEYADKQALHDAIISRRAQLASLKGKSLSVAEIKTAVEAILAEFF